MREFKVRVALEAIKGIRTIQEIAKEFERDRARLHVKIGLLAVKRDWLTRKVQTTRSVRDRIALVDKNHPEISMRKQSSLLGLARSTMTYKPVDEDPEDIRIKRLLDEIDMKDPCLGSRRLLTVLE